MSKTVIVMISGEEHIIEGKSEDVIKKLVDENGNYKNNPVAVGDVVINPISIATVKDKFEHSMMPDITGVSTEW